MHFKQLIRGLNYPEKLHIYLSKDLIDKLIFISWVFFVILGTNVISLTLICLAFFLSLGMF